MTSGKIEHVVMDLQHTKNWTLLLYTLSGTSTINIPKVNIRKDRVSRLVVRKIRSKEKESQNISLNPPSIYI